jgi:fatty acid desaturase
MNDEAQVTTTSEDDLRKRAVEKIRKQDAFKKTALAYVLVNLFLIGVWAIGSGTDTHFWPIWVIGGWGLGLAFQGYDAYGHRGAITEDRVQREMDRLRG